MLHRKQAEQSKFYADVTPEQMMLRDYLALDRTQLANERTLLAYVRTALALFLTGFSSMHLPAFDADLGLSDIVYELFGWALIGAAALAMIIGWIRYRRIKRTIAEAEDLK